MRVINLHMDEGVRAGFAERVSAALSAAGVSHRRAPPWTEAVAGMGLPGWRDRPGARDAPPDAGRVGATAAGMRMVEGGFVRNGQVALAWGSSMAEAFCEAPELLEAAMAAAPPWAGTVDVHVRSPRPKTLRDEALAAALGKWAPDAIWVEDGPSAIWAVLTAIGVEPVAGRKAAAKERRIAAPFELEVSSAGPGGFGSAFVAATLRAEAVSAWEESRGRPAGEGPRVFAELVRLACERLQWRPSEVQWTASGAKLRLTPLGSAPSPAGKSGGTQALAGEIQAAAAKLGMRATFKP